MFHGNGLEDEQINNCILKVAEMVELGHLEGIHSISLPFIKGVQQKEWNIEQHLLVFAFIVFISAPCYGHTKCSKVNYNYYKK